MKKIFLSVCVLGLLYGNTSCTNNNGNEAGNAVEISDASDESVLYKVDATAASVHWSGSKLIGGGHEGSINIKSGDIYVHNDNIEKATFVFDMTSINVKDLEGDAKANLEAHLKGTKEEMKDDFFNVNQHPEATFEASNFDNGKITGNLTIKGITKSISFPATVVVSENLVQINSDDVTINRTDWNITYGSTLAGAAKDKAISDEIKLKIDLKARR